MSKKPSQAPPTDRQKKEGKSLTPTKKGKAKKAAKAQATTRKPRSPRSASHATSAVPGQPTRNRWKFILLGIVLLSIAILASVYSFRRNEIHRYLFERRGMIPGVKVAPGAIPDAARWKELCKELQRLRLMHAERYRKASTAAAKKAVIVDARKLLESNLPELMRCWLGTPWDFNGTAKEPGAEKIACGYFVSTVLEGACFDIQRISLAQQASQNILRTFLPENELQVRGSAYKMYRAEISRNRPGIYIVGLDTHVGFIVVPENRGSDFRFLHASGSQPWCVVDENADQALVLQKSKYRVHGNLTASDAVIRSWLEGKKFRTHR
jgi:cell wall-associated NlpC family hydrolase